MFNQKFTSLGNRLICLVGQPQGAPEWQHMDYMDIASVVSNRIGIHYRKSQKLPTGGIQPKLVLKHANYYRDDGDDGSAGIRACDAVSASSAE